jgi:flagellar FliL protein
MANKPADDEEPIDEADVPVKKSGRGKLLIIAGGVAVLLLGGGAGAYFGGLLDGLIGGGAEEQQQAASEPAPPPPPEPVFYALPELLVSLNTGERRTALLKVKVSLELADPADQPKVERQLPRIVDYCQVYLRELRLDEVRGSAGSVRLREELLRRISAAVAPVQVNDLLFNDLFVQ